MSNVFKVQSQRTSSAYVSVNAHMLACADIYRGMLGIRRVHSKYAELRQITLCYMQKPNFVCQDMFNIYQCMRAYRIYATDTLTIRTKYA